MLDLFQRCDVSAAALANMLNFTENSVTLVKRHLRNKGVDVRIDLHADYDHSVFDQHGRLLKKDDSILRDLQFEHIKEEVI